MIIRSRLVKLRRLEELCRYGGNARVHSKKQISEIARSITRFGFTNPVLVTNNGEIIAGHGRVEAARQLGLEEVPTIELSDLTEAECRAYALADNKIALNSDWDLNLLAAEFEVLSEIRFDLDLTGFSTAEVDGLLTNPAALEQIDEIEQAPPPTYPVTQAGDIWQMGEHRVICGDARDPGTFEALLGVRRRTSSSPIPPTT